MNTSNKYWKDRWEETVGYTLAENFSGYDVICARINYGFEMDFGLERHIEANFSVLGTEEFWAAVVSPLFSIYDDWREYKEKGYDFHNIQLMEVVYGEYPVEAKQRCIEKLREIGSPYEPLERYERPKAPRLERRYEVKSPETKQEIADVDPLAWMDKKDFWDFDREESTELDRTEELVEAPEKQQKLQVSQIGDMDKEFEIICGRITASFHSFLMETGINLKQLRDRRVYLNQYDSFEDCVKHEFGLSRAQAYRLIEASETASLLPEDNQPLAETQVRELTPLAKEDPSGAIQVWESATRKAKNKGKKVTAKDVKTEVENYLGTEKPVKELRSAKKRVTYVLEYTSGEKETLTYKQLLDRNWTEEEIEELEG